MNPNCWFRVLLWLQCGWMVLVGKNRPAKGYLYYGKRYYLRNGGAARLECFFALFSQLVMPANAAHVEHFNALLAGGG